jgi:HK97 family phage major capsid protein
VPITVDAGLIPATIAAEITTAVQDSSVVLRLARRQPMPTGATSVPVLRTLPTAGWVNGRGGRKPEVTIAWSADNIVPEEVAAIVGVPLSLLDDAGVPIWADLKGILAESLAYSIDSAILFGINAPASFAAGGIFAATTVFQPSDTEDLAEAINQAMGAVEDAGLAVTGHAADVSLRSSLRGLRDANGSPLFVPNLSQVAYDTIYGLPVAWSASGAFDISKADLITGDWTKLIVGVRQDITWGESDSAIIQDGTGAIVANAFQQNLKVMRVSMRLGYVVGKPTTRRAGGPAEPFASVSKTPTTGAVGTRAAKTKPASHDDD